MFDFRRLESREEVMAVDPQPFSPFLGVPSFGDPFQRDMSVDRPLAPRLAKGVHAAVPMRVGNNIPASVIDMSAFCDAVVHLVEHRVDSGAGEALAGGYSNLPARGFELLQYVLRGSAALSDPRGTAASVGPGGVACSTAGRGLVCSYGLGQDASDAHWSFHLRINLPAALKAAPPTHQVAPPASVPQVSMEGFSSSTVRVLVGSFSGVSGAVQVHTRCTVLDLHMAPGSAFRYPTVCYRYCLVYVYTGTVTCHGEDGQEHSVGRGSCIEFRRDAGSAEDQLLTLHTPFDVGCSALFIEAEPLNEPVVQRESFVLNTEQELLATAAEIAAGRFPP